VTIYHVGRIFAGGSKQSLDKEIINHSLRLVCAEFQDCPEDDGHIRRKRGFEYAPCLWEDFVAAPIPR